MTALDWIIVVFTGLMAIWGYAQGLIVGALSLLGFAGGALLGSRLGPLLLEEGSQSPYAPLFALVGALLVGGLLASSLELLGFHLRRRLGNRLGLLDGFGGALLVGCLGLGLVWIGGAVALHTPGAGELREPIQQSTILRALNERLPPSGPILQALARFDPFPQIDGPAPNVRPPDSKIARDPQVRAASASVVKVLGTACGLGVQGSGWIAGDGVIVTNAHVVAGQDDTTVQLRGEGDRIDAEAIWFDPRNDLAVLRADAVSGAPALRLNENARQGISAAIAGFPENGPYDVRPGRLGETSTVVTQDAYGRGPVRRSITSLRRVSELARSLAWERSRLSHHVARMERRRLVVREECADDGRGAFVVLTPQGRSALEAAAHHHVCTVRRLLFDPLDDRDVAELTRLMTTLLERASELSTAPRD